MIFFLFFFFSFYISSSSFVRPSKPHKVRGVGVDWEEKKEDDDNDEGERRDEEDMQDSLVVEEGMIVKFPSVCVATFAAPDSRFSLAKRS